MRTIFTAIFVVTASVAVIVTHTPPFPAVRAQEPATQAPLTIDQIAKRITDRRESYSAAVKKLTEDFSKADGEDVAAFNSRVDDLNAKIKSLGGTGGVSKIAVLDLSGKPGPRGFSAYEIAKQNGFGGTEAEWLKFLVGPAGPPGPPGRDGKDAVTPIPVPPTPVADAPIAAPGFHVLLVFQDKDAPKLPKGQFAAIYSGVVRDYLTSHCAADPGSDLKGWRFWDVETDVSQAPKHFQDAFARVKGKQMPWLLVSDGKTGYDGPLPATVEEITAILKKYGGN